MEKLPQTPLGIQEGQTRGVPDMFLASPTTDACAVRARGIYLTAPANADWKAVADRMYRALLGAEIGPFPRRKGVPGLRQRGSRG